MDEIDRFREIANKIGREDLAKKVNSENLGLFMENIIHDNGDELFWYTFDNHRDILVEALRKTKEEIKLFGNLKRRR